MVGMRLNYWFEGVVEEPLEIIFEILFVERSFKLVGLGDVLIVVSQYDHKGLFLKRKFFPEGRVHVFIGANTYEPDLIPVLSLYFLENSQLIKQFSFPN